MTDPAPTSFDDVVPLGELARFNAAVRPSKEALVFEGRSTSYVELDDLSNQVANGLLQEETDLGDGRRLFHHDADWG